MTELLVAEVTLNTIVYPDQLMNMTKEFKKTWQQDDERMILFLLILLNANDSHSYLGSQP